MSPAVLFRKYEESSDEVPIKGSVVRILYPVFEIPAYRIISDVFFCFLIILAIAEHMFKIRCLENFVVITVFVLNLPDNQRFVRTYDSVQIGPRVFFRSPADQLNQNMNMVRHDNKTSDADKRIPFFQLKQLILCYFSERSQLDKRWVFVCFFNIGEKAFSILGTYCYEVGACGRIIIVRQPWVFSSSVFHNLAEGIRRETKPQ